jgi:hypothetical protein
MHVEESLAVKAKRAKSTTVVFVPLGESGVPLLFLVWKVSLTASQKDGMATARWITLTPRGLSVAGDVCSDKECRLAFKRSTRRTVRLPPDSGDAGDGANCFCALFKEQLIYEQSASRPCIRCRKTEPTADHANHRKLNSCTDPGGEGHKNNHHGPREGKLGTFLFDLALGWRFGGWRLGETCDRY